MSRVWISKVASNYALFDKPGVRAKLRGREWDPACFEQAAPDDELWSVLRRYMNGEELAAEDFPEKAAVWNPRAFKRTGQLFAIAGFYVLKSRLAGVMRSFDFGLHPLIGVEMYQADLTTIDPGNYFFLNFGPIKNSFLPSKSRNVGKAVNDAKTGHQLWRAQGWHEDGDVALSPSALIGADLWHEEFLVDSWFVSDALALALETVGMRDAFSLKECRIADA